MAADRQVRDAARKTPLERLVVQTAADKLRSEGEASAVKLEQEGENQAKAVMDAAQKRADELRRN
jgi:23S rRNA U2552 (ribose-2'-O)-methylase RlmE/FtsJ